MFASSSQAATDVQLWHSYLDQEQTALNLCIQRFNQQQSQIRIKAVYLPFDEISQQLSSKNSELRPDLFIFAHDRLGSWLQQKLLSPLPDAAQQQARQQAIGSTLDALTVDNQLYGWPLNFKTLALVYNPALLDKAPSQTSDFAALAKTLHPIQVLSYEYDNLYYHAALANALDPNWLKQGIPDWQNPALSQSVELLKNWYQNHWLPEQTSAGLVIDQFNRGQVAAIFAGPWTLPSLTIPYRLAALPQLSEAKQPLKPWLTVEGLFLSARSLVKNEASQVAQSLTSTECALDLSQKGHQLPARQDLYQRPEIAADPILSSYYQQSLVALPMPKDAGLSQLWQPMAQFLSDITQRKQEFSPAYQRLKQRLKLD